MKSSVLFIIFNRPETTRQVFQVIKEAKPTRLYIAADGPRDNVVGEIEKCNQARAIVNEVDWPCEVKTLFQDKNLGCQYGVVAGINWFFENEEEGIIIEDDVVPQNEFFEFCDINLERYKNQHNVFAILGFNQFGQGVTSNSYFFSRGFYAWGWATWKSRWLKYQVHLNKKEINKVYYNEKYPRYVKDAVALNLQLVMAGFCNTWDFQMVYAIITNNAYTIVPFANLTKNIGTDGAHSYNNAISHEYGKLDLQSLEHPSMISDNDEINKKLWLEYRHFYHTIILKRLLLKLGVYGTSKRIINYFR